jgi:hypothetical protein
MNLVGADVRRLINKREVQLATKFEPLPRGGIGSRFHEAKRSEAPHLVSYSSRRQGANRFDPHAIKVNRAWTRINANETPASPNPAELTTPYGEVAGASMAR